jgi:16S rRNA processing protein RimM
MSATSKPTAPKPERVELRVARLVKAHGLKGGLKLEVYTDDPELRFKTGNEFTLQVPEDSAWFGKKLRLASIREINSSPVAFFEGVDRSHCCGIARESDSLDRT